MTATQAPVWEDAPTAIAREPDGRLQDRLDLLVEPLRQTARELDALWSETLDQSELNVRVVEASHALHRAVLALEADFVIGGRRGL